MGQGPADDLGLFVDFLGHEVPMVALVHDESARSRLLPLALDLAVIHVPEAGSGAVKDYAITVFQIGDRVGERRQRQRV